MTTYTNEIRREVIDKFWDALQTRSSKEARLPWMNS